MDIFLSLEDHLTPPVTSPPPTVDVAKLTPPTPTHVQVSTGATDNSNDL